MKKSIPFLDLHAIHEPLEAEFKAAFDGLLQRGDFIQGKAVGDFERAFAQYCGSPHAVGCANGTAALHAIIEALGIGAGDEVILPSHTFIATAESVRLSGATPVFVDIDEATWLIDPKAVEAAITPRTRAIVPVHLYGMPAHMEALNAVGCANNLPVIEDSAQGHGGTLNGRRAGNLGLAAAFSFYPGKNLGALGDAGAVTTMDSALAEKMRRYVNHGREGKYEHLEMGTNYRLDTLQAALLSVKLPRLDSWNAKRREAAAVYRRLLSAPEYQELGLRFQQSTPGAESCYHLFVVTLPHRDQIAEALKADGITTGLHYPIPSHLQPSMAAYSLGKGSLPITERVASSLLSLPMCPTLREEDVVYICERLLLALRQNTIVKAKS